jgi:hypothetical protein
MADVALATCPRCGAPRAASLDCPKCGVIYAKAHQPHAPAAALQVPEPEASTGVWEGDLEDARLEHRLRLFAVPVALVFAHLVVATRFGHAVTRIFLSMFVHELGHAVAAWLCGFTAFPALWVTWMSSARVASLAIVLSFALGLGTFWLWRVGRQWSAAALGTVLVLQLALTLGLSTRSAEALIAFGGDAGCFVLGAALMCTFYANSESSLVRGWLRWGFLVIGAFAFSDALATWWAARSDSDAIPFGEIEGVGLSDPSKLTETYGWTIHQLINRYLVVAAVSFAALAVGYAAGLRRPPKSQLPRPLSPDAMC